MTRGKYDNVEATDKDSLGYAKILKHQSNVQEDLENRQARTEQRLDDAIVSSEQLPIQSLGRPLPAMPVGTLRVQLAVRR